MSVLIAVQEKIAQRVIAEEAARREHVVVALSGAHAYGFPSPDSDLDLKAIHVAPTRALLGLAPTFGGGERMEIVEGVEVDYSSNELAAALSGILGGNGNYLERVMGSIVLASSAAHESLVPIVRRAVSRRMHRHYHGFATGILKELARTDAPTAKQVLYVLRTALTGTHLLRTGEVVTDVRLLLDENGLGAARELIERKRAGERTVLGEADRQRWIGVAQRAMTVLDEACERSPLPEEPANREELDSWLIDLRRGRV
jgi:predicted nucleotidyltransferase